jgi:hypothetical protein
VSDEIKPRIDEVPRYKLSWVTGYSDSREMMEHQGGDWVRYEDYLRVAQWATRAHAALSPIKKNSTHRLGSSIVNMIPALDIAECLRVVDDYPGEKGST